MKKYNYSSQLSQLLQLQCFLLLGQAAFALRKFTAIGAGSGQRDR